jgi:hypothetical protein
MAVLVGGAAGWTFALVGPLMAAALLGERLFERRDAARGRVAEAVALATTVPSAQGWMQVFPPALTWWQAGLNQPVDQRVRVGVRRLTARELAPGAGRQRIEIPVLIDISGGPEIHADSRVIELVTRALRANRGRVYDPVDDVPPINVGASASQPSQRRWFLNVDPLGVGVLHDRLGLQPEVGQIEVDVLGADWEESVVALEMASRVVGVNDLDLAVDGPHALVSGVTGSGKTEFLIAWLRAMAANLPVEALAIAIIDFKGGGSFGRLARLPHIRHIVSDLDPHGLETALEGVRALLETREKLLARHGVPHVQDLPQHARVPRVVIVVDEFRALIEAFPAYGQVLNDVAARGRALGIHVVLSTQRFTATASDALLANCNLRVVFRTGDRAESLALLGVPTAFTAGLRPGHALVHRGRGVEALTFSLVEVNTPTSEPGESQGAMPLWLEPLPSRPQMSEFTDASSEPSPSSGLALGLIDDHANLRRRVMWWRPVAHGTLLVTGGSGALRRELCTVLAAAVPGAIVLDGSPALAWDVLACQLHAPGLFVPALDSLVARLPAAWRDDFVDRVMAGAHEIAERGLPVCLGFASESALSARLQQLTSTVARVADDRRGLIEFESVMVKCFAVAANPRPATPSPTLEMRSLASWLAADPRPVMLITSTPGAWHALETAGVRLMRPDAVIAAAYSSPGSPAERILLDGCSPAEVRAMRLTSEPLPPPLPGVLLALTDQGGFERLWVEQGERPRSPDSQPR